VSAGLCAGVFLGRRWQINHEAPAIGGLREGREEDTNCGYGDLAVAGWLKSFSAF